MCCSVPGGTLGRHPPSWGTPHPDLAGGRGYPGQVPSGWGTSWPGRGVPQVGAPPGWGTPILTWMGYPGQVPPGWGTPSWPEGTLGRCPLAGVPPHPDLASGGYPRQAPPLAGVPPILTWLGDTLGRCPLAGVPHPSQVWTDKVKLLPPVSYYVRGR